MGDIMNPLVMSILNNPSKHQVNRADKMSKTLDVMSNNAQKITDEKALYLEQSTGDIQLDGSHYGYGTGRKQGD
jgi:hypothetical protein